MESDIRGSKVAPASVNVHLKQEEAGQERVFPLTGDEVWYHKLNSSNRETSFLRARCMIDNKMKVTSINLVTS